MSEATASAGRRSAVPGREPTQPIPLPLVLQGRYRVGTLVGLGNASRVYRGRDLLLGRDVAIKVFTASAAGSQDLEVQEREARLLAGLNHPALVTLMDAGVDAADPVAPRVFLVMEFLPDLDLGTRLRHGKLSPFEVAYLGWNLLGGLEHVHANGILHLDLKPANVLLAKATDGPIRGKLADFGIAALQGRQEGTSRRAHSTTAYLSPEQLEGRPLGPATDIYSLGLVLIEALTGQPAFPSDQPESATGPAPLAEILRRMTARDPASRPSAAEAVIGFRDIILAASGGGPYSWDPEAARVAVVREYNLIDAPPDAEFDRITAVAARVFQVPVAIISAVDDKHVWLKSHHGLDASERSRTRALGVTGGIHEETLILEDVLTDPRTTHLPPDGRGFRFYAGVPLITEDAFNVGTFAIADYKPRPMSPSEAALLQDLAATVLHEMNLRRAARRLAMSNLQRPA